MLSLPGSGITLCVQCVSSLGKVSSVLLPAPGGRLSHLMLSEGSGDKGTNQPADTLYSSLIHQDACFRFGSEKQEEGCQDWEGVNWTKSTKEILCAARKQEWKSATVWRVNSLSTPDTDQSPHKS